MTLTNNYEVTVAASLTTAIIAIWIMTYSKSPIWQDKKRLTIALTLISISAIAMYFTKGFWNDDVSTGPITIERLWIIPFLAFTCYCTVSILLIFFMAYRRKGIGNLKKISEGGLVSWLASGLVVGSAIELLAGIVIGSAFWLVDGLVIESAFWLAVGLSGGLAGSFVIGSVVGLAYEPKKA